ncbi:MAG: hypothetical protein D6739_04925 [Nitrospirae bacterium]|nr:MAG: hypothetical protein D6739_04925 [Nitrospirota bacterium]
MERRDRWVDRILDAYGTGVELLGHMTDRLARLGRQVRPAERERLERLKGEARRLIEAHRGGEGDRSAVRALHHEIALLEAAVVARRFRHLAERGAWEEAGEALLLLDEMVEGAAAALGEDHPEVAAARRRLRRLLEAVEAEVRRHREGADWMLQCLARFREEGAAAEWPPYPAADPDQEAAEAAVAEEDVDGM